MSEETVGFTIRSAFDPKGAKDAEASLKNLGETADGAFKNAQVGVGALKGALIEVAAMLKVLEEFKEGFDQIATMEAHMNKLERAAARMGDSFENVKGEIEGFAQSLFEAAGIDDDEAIPAMIDLYNATGDVEKALTLARLAADVSIGTNKSFAEAQQAVMSAAMGNTRALKEFGIVLDDSLAPKEKAAKALQILNERFGGAAENAKGTRVELAKLGEAWEGIRNSVIEPMVPIVTGVMKGMLTAVQMTSAAFEHLLAAARAAVQILGVAGKAIGDLFSGNFKALAGRRDEWKKINAEYAEITRDVWDRAATDFSKAWGTNQEKVKLGHANVAGAILNYNDKTDKATEKTLAHQYDDHVKYFAKVNAIALKFSQHQQENAVWLAEVEKKLLAEYVAARQQAAELELNIERDKARIIAQLNKQRGEDAQYAMGVVMDAARTAFGDSKELAIAQAIINTYEGASKALSQGGIYGAVLAAIVVAAGMAQVAKIASTEPSTTGGGFDDPANDRAARLGGYRWAKDMVAEFTLGVSQGWREGMVGTAGKTGPVTDNSRHFNVTMNLPGVVDPTQQNGLKMLGRSISTVEKQVEGARTLARRA